MGTLAHMRRGTTRRLVTLAAAALLVLAFMPLGVAQADHLVTDPVANPDLPGQCGIDIVLLMDSSGSINPTEEGQLETAYFAFLNALADTGARAGVVDFDTTATVEIQPGPDYLSITPGNIAGTFTTYINGFSSGGFTNWEAAFDAAATFTNPDLVVLLTDGDPTTYGNGTDITSDTDVALEPAIGAANTLKTAGIHILAVGVGSDPDEFNLTHVSGPDVYDTNVAAINASTVPGLDVILADFAELDTALGNWAAALCAEITLTKTGAFTTGDGSAVGDEITYTYEIENTGSVELTNVELDDALTGLVDYVCDGVSTLAPAETTTCTATYSIDQDDLDAGEVYNTATATGEAGGSPVSDDDDWTEPTIQNPDITLDKTGSFTSGDGSTVGDTITYTFEIENTGNVTLTGVDLTDALVGLSGATCGDTELAPGDTTSCTATYDIDQDDIEAGGVDNTAEACGDDPDEFEVCDDDPLRVPTSPTPDLSVEKAWTDHDDANSDGLVSEGETLEFTITATNTGNVTLNNVVVTDTIGLTNTSGTTPCASVAPGGTCTLIGDYVVDAGDFEVGSVENTGCADSDETSEVCDDIEVEVEDPRIEVDKSPDDQFIDQGQSFTWTITVTNTGNVDLVNVEVDDPNAPDCDETIGALAVDQVYQYTCVVDDVQNPIFNVATASGDYETVTVEDDDNSNLFVIAAAAAIGDKVFLDEDGDGIEDAEDTGIPNVDVDLYQCLDLTTDPECDDLFVFVDSTTTDGDGIYNFINLEVGDYRVIVDSSDVDGDSTTPEEFIVPLASEEEFLNADFGFEETLPVTGMNTGEMGWFGLALLALGGMLIVGSGIARREEEQ